jgi:hypothetical protein
VLLSILSSSSITAFALLYLFLKHPEKVERWIAILSRAAARLSERAAKTHMAADIQSTIDERRKKLNIHEGILAYGVSVKWTDADQIQTDLRENKIVVMMRPYTSQARNLAHVVSVYVPGALLPKCRRYVEPNLMSGIDHTISKSVLEKNPPALEYYLTEIMSHISDEVRSYIEKMDKVHQHGSLTRMLLPELRRLNMLYPQEPDYRVPKETAELARLVYEFASKEPGVDVSPSYVGTHIKMAIVMVAKAEKVLLEGTASHLTFMEGALDQGIDHFYVVSTGPLIKYAKGLVKDSLERLNLMKVHEEEYDGSFRGRITKMFCALLLSAS